MYPELRLVDRSGRLLCGMRLHGLDGSDCGRPAQWHVAWSLDYPAVFSLVCREHMGYVLEGGWTYADAHPAETACDMPSTGWSIGPTWSECVMISTEDVEWYEKRNR